MDRGTNQRAIDAEIASMHGGGSPPYMSNLFWGDMFSLPKIARGLRWCAPQMRNTLKTSKQPESGSASRRGL